MSLNLPSGTAIQPGSPYVLVIDVEEAMAEYCHDIRRVIFDHSMDAIDAYINEHGGLLDACYAAVGYIIDAQTPSLSEGGWVPGRLSTPFDVLCERIEKLIRNAAQLGAWVESDKLNHVDTINNRILTLGFNGAMSLSVEPPSDED